MNLCGMEHLGRVDGAVLTDAHDTAFLSNIDESATNLSRRIEISELQGHDCAGMRGPVY